MSGHLNHLDDILTNHNRVLETTVCICKHQCVNRKWLSVQSQIRQQEEVEKRAEVAMEMSDLVVYCQPRSKEKDRFGKHMQMLILNTKTCK